MNNIKAPRIPKNPARLVNDLKAQLFLLRQSLLNSFTNSIYYKELANKLRLLIYEKSGSKNYTPLLLVLADKYNVKYSVTLEIPFPSKDYPFKTPGTGTVEFRDYLILPILYRNSKHINASQLILDIATQMGGAHEDLTMVEYLKPASIQYKGLPYHLEIIQEVSVHVLRFGDLILQKAIEDFGRAIVQDDIDEEVLAPNIICPNCNQALNYGQFLCGKCNYKFERVLKPLTLQEQFGKLFKSENVLSGTGTFSGWYSIPQLFDLACGPGRIFDYCEGDFLFSLYRDEDNYLVFQRNSHDKSYSAKINLADLTPSDWVYLSITFSPNSLGIFLGAGKDSHSYDEVHF